MRAFIGVILGIAIGIIATTWWEENMEFPVTPPNYDSVRVDQKSIDHQKQHQHDSLLVTPLINQIIECKAKHHQTDLYKSKYEYILLEYNKLLDSAKKSVDLKNYGQNIKVIN